MKEYWSVLLFPSPGDLPDPGIEPRSLALQADSLSFEPQGKYCIFLGRMRYKIDTPKQGSPTFLAPGACLKVIFPQMGSGDAFRMIQLQQWGAAVNTDEVSPT